MIKKTWNPASRLCFVISVGVLSSNTGCKPVGNDAKSKSLDNFTSKNSGSLTFNSCSGSNSYQPPQGRLVGNAQETSAMQAALTAVPKELQSAFFMDLQGSINTTKNLPSACGAAAASSTGADDMLACWRGGESGIAIYIKSESDDSLTVRNIKHSVVRMMGYVLTDVILKAKQSGGEAQITENSALSELKKDIAAALAADSAKSKDYRVPDSLKSDQRKYQDAAFAEAFDSYYCSVASQRKMSSNFPTTFGKFAEVANILPDALAGTVDSGEGQSTNVQASGSGSFSLWGRYGWGNGPMRQAFSNWSGYRSNGGGLMNFRRWNNGGGFFFNRR
jgi:hypothetical protein